MLQLEMLLNIRPFWPVKTCCAVLFLSAFFNSTASAQLRSENAVLRWNTVALYCTKAVKLGPPMVARALAMTHTASYDAWAAYDAEAFGTRLGGALRRSPGEFTNAHKELAISYAAYDVLLNLFPSQKAFLDLQLSSSGGNSADRSETFDTAAGIGHAAARALLQYRNADGSNQANGYTDTTGYQPVNTATSLNDPTRWQPLIVPNGKGGFTTQNYLGSHWGQVRPFALTSGSQFRPSYQVPAADSAKYAEDVAEAISYSALLTDHQKIVAEYWADGPNSETPPGHWVNLAAEISRKRGHSLDQDIKLFFLLSNSLFDAGIAAWDAKRAYETVRPITAIRYLMKGKTIQAWGGPFVGTVRLSGEMWSPYQASTFVTPAFPEYVSGHSTFSAAAAEILKRFSGSDLFGLSYVVKAGSSMFEPGIVPAQDLTLSWSTFSEAADEAGLSRRYGGIHFVAADLDGRKLGRQVGASVWEVGQSYISGALK